MAIEYYNPKVRSRIFICHDDVGVMVIPKVASSSIQRFAAKNGIPVHEIGKDRKPRTMVAFICDPVKRLRSAYQFFVERRCNGVTGSYEGFVDEVLSGHPDGHWMRQSDFIEGIGGLVVYRFEDINEKFPFGSLDHINKSVSKDIDANYRLRDIRRHYAQDYGLRNGKCR